MKIGSFISRFRQRVSVTYPCMISLSSGSTSTSSSCGSMIRSKSEENLTKLNDCMDNMDQDVGNLFLQFHQTDFRQDPELLRLLNDYFNSSKDVTKICESLRKFLEADECFLLDQAFRDFEQERLGYGGLVQGSFRKTLGDLRNFKKMGDQDCLTEDFLVKLGICHEDLANMIVKLESTMKDIDKKLKRVRGKRAIVTAAILAPVIAVMVASRVVAGIFSSLPTEPVIAFATSRWKKSTETLKREKKAVTSMERGAMLALKEVEKISRLVCRLETVERSIRVKAEFAVTKTYPLATAMSGMEEERKCMKATLVDLDRETGMCDGFAQFGRSMAHQRLVEFLSCGEIGSK